MFFCRSHIGSPRLARSLQTAFPLYIFLDDSGSRSCDVDLSHDAALPVKPRHEAAAAQQHRKIYLRIKQNSTFETRQLFAQKKKKSPHWA